MKISVLTLTYQRHHLLEEAMQSFLEQKFRDGLDVDMVVLNDSQSVMYTYEPTHVTRPISVINHPHRFSSIGKKLEYGLKHCKGDFVYRLDDDDLLAPWAMELTRCMIEENPNQEVYRSSHFYLYWDNTFKKAQEGINTGNVFSRDYINRLDFPDTNADEDLDIVFSPNVKMHTDKGDKHTMIYRWANKNSYHISTQLHLPSEQRLDFIREQEDGIIELLPNFDTDYYSQLPHNV